MKNIFILFILVLVLIYKIYHCYNDIRSFKKNIYSQIKNIEDFSQIKYNIKLYEYNKILIPIGFLIIIILMYKQIYNIWHESRILPFYVKIYGLKITIYLLIFFILNGFIELYCIKKKKEEIIKLKEYVNEKNKERLYLKKSTQEDGPEWWAIL